MATPVKGIVCAWVKKSYTGCVDRHKKKWKGKKPCQRLSELCPQALMVSHSLSQGFTEPVNLVSLSLFLSYAFIGHKPQERGKRKLKINQDRDWFYNDDQIKIVMTKVFRGIPYWYFCLFLAHRPVYALP